MRNLQKYQSDYELIFREELLANFYEHKAGCFTYRHPNTGHFINLGSNRCHRLINGYKMPLMVIQTFIK